MLEWGRGQITIDDTYAAGNLIADGLPGAPRLVFETWDYDRWGNCWAQNALNGGPSPQFTYNTANNQISGYTYDAAGNLTNDGAHTYTYNAEGDITAVDLDLDQQ